MPQQPSSGKPVEIIKEFKGLNDQSDSVKRPKGTVTDGQNIYDEQAGDANRRAGRILDSLSDGNSIDAIFNLTWDDGAVSVVNQSGTSFQFDTFTFPNDETVAGLLAGDPCADGSESPTNPTTGEPLCPPDMPTGSIYLPGRKSQRPVPDFVPIIRAMSEAYYFSQKGIALGLTMPNQVIAADFYTRTSPRVKVAESIRDKTQFLYWYNRGFVPRIGPTSGPITPTAPHTSMVFDRYYVDYVMQGPARYTADLNSLISKYNLTVLTTYLKTNPDRDPTTLANYTSADQFSWVATQANYKEVCAQFAGIINAYLRKVKVAATQGSFQTKTGDAEDSGSCSCGTLGPCYKIDVVPVGMFAPGIGCNAQASGAPAWDGTFSPMPNQLNCFGQCDCFTVTGPNSIDGCTLATEAVTDCDTSASTCTYLIQDIGAVGEPCWHINIAITNISGDIPGDAPAVFYGGGASTPVGTYNQTDDTGCLIFSGLSFTVSAC